MRTGPGRYALGVTLLALASAVSLHASQTTFQPHSSPVAIFGQAQDTPQSAAARYSLTRDVLDHPGDFIAFETKASAMRFISQHAPEAQREAEKRVAARGILGYWRDKTLVVLPSLCAPRP